jgi:hypothetical protein
LKVQNQNRQQLLIIALMLSVVKDISQSRAHDDLESSGTTGSHYLALRLGKNALS